MKQIFTYFIFLWSVFAFSQNGNILIPQTANSGLNSNSNSNSKITLGGNIGINGGSYGLGLVIAPRIGYKITENLEAAMIVNYTLQQTEYYRNNMLGFGPTLNYYLGRSFYANATYHHYMVTQKHKTTRVKYKVDEDALYLGAGYLQHLGGNTYAQVGVSYNVLYKEGNSIFSSGFIPNVGIIIGL